MHSTTPLSNPTSSENMRRPSSTVMITSSSPANTETIRACHTPGPNSFNENATSTG